jgi:hypothetical protein
MALLTSAFAALLTPNLVLSGQAISGSEIDFTSPEFWDWYDANDATTNKTHGGQSPCFWNNYESSTGKTLFPTCQFADDPVGFISSGVSAAQFTLGEFDSTIRVVNRFFAGSTGGVIPVGWGGISAFSDIHGDEWQINSGSTNFNYTLVQQGLSAEVSCQQASNDITMSINNTWSVTNTAMNNVMELATYESNACGAQTATMVVPSVASIGTFFCQPDPNVKRFDFYLTPFDGYTDKIPEVTCTLEPFITRNFVTYNSTNDLFGQQTIERIADSAFIPNETVDAIRQLFISSVTSWVSNLLSWKITWNLTIA